MIYDLKEHSERQTNSTQTLEKKVSNIVGKVSKMKEKLRKETEERWLKVFRNKRHRKSE